MIARRTSAASFSLAPRVQFLLFILHPLTPPTETKNVVNDANDGYDHILEYIPIGKPNAQTLAKLDALEPSTITGDRMYAPFCLP
jgi:hypothetical protein